MSVSNAVLLQEGMRLHRQGDLGGASSRYRQVLAIEPANADALYGLAVIACQQGRFQDGIDLVRRALTGNPQHARAHNLLGTALMRLARPGEARAAFEAAVAIDPEFAEAHGNLGHALGELGLLDEAVASFDRALSLAPDSIADWCNRAAALEDLGRLQEAVESYDRALALRADIPDALLARANALARAGRSMEAIDGYERLLDLSPEHAQALLNHGKMLRRLGRFELALASIQRASAIMPSDTAALVECGDTLNDLGRHEQALAAYDRALVLKADHTVALNNRGTVLAALQRHEEALAAYETALRIDPNRVETLFNRGAVLDALKRPGDAARAYDGVLALDPGHVAALCARGASLVALNRFDEGLASYERALAIAPDHIEALFGRGHALLMLDRPGRALADLDRVLELSPDHAAAADNRGSALLELGRPAEAVAAYRHALALKPVSACHTSLIFALNFDPDADTGIHQAERARWHELHAGPLAATIGVHGNDRDPARRLRIGYVSGHFRQQASSFAFGGVIVHHDPEAVEVFCYSDTETEDEATRLFRARADHWRDAAALSDEHLAERIRADRIDILVDTTGHMARNRLLVFARKPAPIQVTGWGEPTGTGLKTVDYLLADPVLVPAHERPLFAERIFDLPNFLGYWTPQPLPEPSPLPALQRGYVTFGSFNRIAKIQDPVLRTWAAILRALPSSRLVLKADQLLADASRRTRIDAVLEKEGIRPDRVSLLPRSGRAEHFAAYQGIDIALDPFPHGGGMTTLDSLWMGVPVVTSPGASVSSRLAAASLSALSLAHFIAPDRAHYVDLAVASARESESLARLRSNLRGRMANSEFGDPRRYAASVEAAYREMWRRWCGSGPRAPGG